MQPIHLGTTFFWCQIYGWKGQIYGWKKTKYLAEKAKYMAEKACLHLVNPLLTQKEAFLTLPFSTQVWWIEQKEKLNFFYQKNLFSSKFAPDFHPHREPDPSPDMLWGGDTFYVNLFFQMRFEIFRDFIFYVSSPDILRDERRRGRSHQRRFNHHQRHQQCAQHTQQVFVNIFEIYLCSILFPYFVLTWCISYLTRNRWQQLTLVLTLKEISFQLLRLFTKSNFNFTTVSDRNCLAVQKNTVLKSSMFFR